MTEINKESFLSKYFYNRGSFEVFEEIKKVSNDNSITCELSNKIAKKIGVDPLIIGANLNILGIRIKKCQLNLFGCNDKQKKMNDISQDLRICIEENIDNNELTCQSAWEISKKMNFDRVYFFSICQLLKIKIIECQLGAF